MKRREPADKIIKDTTNWYNSIVAQRDKFVYFVLKTETSNEENYLRFYESIDKSIEINCQKNQHEYRTILDEREINPLK